MVDIEIKGFREKWVRVLYNWWRVILGVIVLIIILSILIWVGYKLAWTGFGTKTLWDWMQLLIVPIVLVGGAYWLNKSVSQEEARERAALELNMAVENKRDDILQTYLDKMTELFLDKKLYESEVESQLRAVVRARTLTVLRGLDGNRKGELIMFLYEASLIYKDKIVINLSMADLSEANLSEANLSEANLSEVNLIGADLSNAILFDAKLDGADLSEAELYSADLSDANLSKANLSGANLFTAILRGAKLDGADLSKANLSSADLSGVDLSGAKLQGVDLENANLHWANLSKVDLRDAKYNKDTKWPKGFDPEKAGAILVKE